MSSTLRVVLADSVSRDQIDDLLHARGWSLRTCAPAAVGRPAQLVCVSRNGEDLLHVVHDPALGAQYCAVTGPGAAAHADAIRAALPCTSDADVDALVRADDPPAFLRGLACRVLTHDPADPRVERDLLRGLEHPHAAARAGAVIAAAYVGIPAVAQRLRALASDDPDPEVRRRAAAVAASQAP